MKKEIITTMQGLKLHSFARPRLAWMVLSEQGYNSHLPVGQQPYRNEFKLFRVSHPEMSLTYSITAS